MKTRLYSAEMLLLLTTFIAGWGWVFSKESTVEMPIFGFLGYRFGLAAILVAFLGIGTFRHINSRQWRDMVIGGMLQAANIGCWMYAVNSATTLGDGAFIMSLSMLTVPLLDLVVLRRFPSKAYWYSLPIALAGLAMLTMSGHTQFSSSQMWFLIAAFMQAVYFRFNSFFTTRVPIIPLTAVQLAITGLSSLVVSYFWETWPAEISDVTWGWFIASVIVATSLRFWLQLKGQQSTSPTNAAVIMIMEPVFTLLISAYWYGEQLPAMKLVGCLLILSAQIFYRITLNRQMRLKEINPIQS